VLKGFKEFLSRGNIVDLAVAVVIGTAFTLSSRRSPTASLRR
jgi:large-conductance mechanosensitive channel